MGNKSSSESARFKSWDGRSLKKDPEEGAEAVVRSARYIGSEKRVKAASAAQPQSRARPRPRARIRQKVVSSTGGIELDCATAMSVRCLTVKKFDLVRRSKLASPRRRPCPRTTARRRSRPCQRRSSRPSGGAGPSQQSQSRRKTSPHTSRRYIFITPLTFPHGHSMLIFFPKI